MLRLFGKKKEAPAHPVQPKSKHEEIREILTKRIGHLDAKIQSEQDKACQLAKTGNKQAALFALKRRKLFIEQLDKIQDHLCALEAAQYPGYISPRPKSPTTQRKEDIEDEWSNAGFSYLPAAVFDDSAILAELEEMMRQEKIALSQPDPAPPAPKPARPAAASSSFGGADATEEEQIAALEAALGL